MKRDMELARAILFALEEIGEHDPIPNPFIIEGYDPKTVGHHVHLLAEAGLITAISTKLLSDLTSQAMPRELTWLGHDFIDTMRSQEVWEKTKTAMKEVGGGSFGLMLEFGKKAAEGYLKAKLKEMTGIDLA